MNATIHSDFWTDARVEELPSGQKLALLWLLTNPSRDLCGFTRVTPRRFALDTGLTVRELEEACGPVGGSFRVLPGGVFFASRFLRHQFGKGGEISQGNKVVKAAIRQASSMPAVLRDAFFEAYPEFAALMEPAAPETHGSASPAPVAAAAASADDSSLPTIPHRSPIQTHGCPNSIAKKKKEQEQKREKEQEQHLLEMPDDPERETPATAEDPASIAGLYPRRQAVQEAVTHIARAIAEGVDPRTIAEGTRAIAAVIRQLPSGHLNAYVPSAGRFFEKRRWEDDPQTWLRHAGTRGHRPGNGAQPGKLSLGGRTGTTIKIGG